MLLHQGAAAFTLWTGQTAPLELMQAKLAEARAGGLESAEGEPTGGRGRARPPRHGRLTAGRTVPRRRDGCLPLPDRRRVARPGARGHRRGRPGRARADRGRARGRPRPPPARLRPRRAPGDRARPRRDPRRRPARDRRSARRSCCSSATATGRTGRGSCRSSRSATRRPPSCSPAADDGQQAGDPGHPGPARPRRPRRRPQVRLQRRAQRARARVRARDRRAGRGRRRRAGVPARARHRGLVVHGGGRRRGRRSGERDPLARRGRRLAAALPRPRRRGRDDRPDRRGAVEPATRSAACSRSWSTGCRSGSARTSTGTAGSTPRWPRRS